MVIHQQEKDDSPRYMEILTGEIKAALSVQNVILHQSRRILDDLSFIEVLSPVIGPRTDPSRKRERSAPIDYYGLPYKLMNDRTIYKQALIRSFNNVYTISPNVRLEPLSLANSSFHLSEFYKIDR
ncbi:MAG: amino acid--tRNA ligase-related protein [Candidatus Heimdallarchaeaceae archaeon]|jgi:asparaginyl-tRNA synthetase